jgi:hypothetical protein
LHSFKGVGLKTGLDNSMPDAMRMELLARLHDDFAPMRENKNATTVGGIPCDDFASDDRLAGAGWGNDDDPARSRSHGFMEIGHDLFLIGTKGD